MSKMGKFFARCLRCGQVWTAPSTEGHSCASFTGSDLQPAWSVLVGEADTEVVGERQWTREEWEALKPAMREAFEKCRSPKE